MAPGEDAAAEILALLAAHQVMTLATSGPDGPWAAAVFYAHRDWDLFWFSSPGARHSRNLAADARLAAAIQRDAQQWETIQGLQLSGEAADLGPALEQTDALSVLSAKYLFLDEAAAGSGPLAAALAKVHIWRFRPREIRIIDNARGFGRPVAFVPPLK